MKMYKTGGWKELIEVVEVTRANEKSVWRFSPFLKREFIRAKRSNHGNYWDTIEEAKAHLKEKYNEKIQSAEKQIEKAKAHLEALNKY